MEKIEIRGLPAGVWSIFAMSSGEPSSHVAKPGEARRLLNFSASVCRGFSGMNDSRSITPTLSNAGFWMCRIKVSNVTFWPSAHAFWKIAATSTASGLWIASPFSPTSESSDATVLSTRSPSSSASSMISNGGTSRELRMLTGIPALLPGVKMLMSTLLRSVVMRSGFWPQSARPFFHVAAVWAANSSGETPFFVASSSLIQGRKLFASRSGNISSRLEMSPLGSMMIAGILSIAASSSSARQRPVFPEPVMPSTTPWVTRSFES